MDGLAGEAICIFDKQGLIFMVQHKMGEVQVYTGNGKGKTTAAFGLALRASGAGFRTSIHQFIKNKGSGEVIAVKNIKNIVVRCGGASGLIMGKPKASDRKAAKACLERARKDMVSGKFDIVVLDEVNVALKLGLVDKKEMLEIIDCRPRGVELVLTGRYCPSCIMRKADLVTEMKELRHPYKKGIPARKGIEY